MGILINCWLFFRIFWTKNVIFEFFEFLNYCFPVFISCFCHVFSIFFNMVERSWFEVYFPLEKSVGFLEMFSDFLTFFWILLNFDTKFNLCLFLVSITFFLFFSQCFYDLVSFYIQDGRTIMILGVFCIFYWIWKKVRTFL